MKKLKKIWKDYKSWVGLALIATLVPFLVGMIVKTVIIFFMWGWEVFH